VLRKPLCLPEQLLKAGVGSAFGARQRLDARLQARRMGAAFEVVLAQARRLQPGPHRLDMARLAAVRGAGERDVLVARPNFSTAPLSTKAIAWIGLLAERGRTRASMSPHESTTVPSGFTIARHLVPALDQRSAGDFDDDRTLAHCS
jgi:hypothetical protein